MKDALGSDFFEEWKKELDETNANVMADMREREARLQEFIAAGERY